MDEGRRRLERRIEAEGDALARVRLAQERLRAADPAGALVALGEPASAGDPDALGLDADARGRALLDLGRSDEALATLRRAADAGAALDARALAALLEPLVAVSSVAARACAAAVVARLRDGDGVVTPLRDRVARDPEPLVRLALVRERPPFDVARDRSSRVYGSHGRDYETGIFITFEMPHDLRLGWFEPRLGASVNAGLASLADDATAIESLGLRTAYGEGYGLGGVHDMPDGGLALEAAVRKLNALDLVPFRLRLCGVRPYDLMEDEARLAHQMAEDLRGHPARQRPAESESSLVERIVALHPHSAIGVPAPRAVLATLLAEAREHMTPVGLRALKIFASLNRGRTKF